MRGGYVLKLNSKIVRASVNVLKNMCYAYPMFEEITWIKCGYILIWK
jgi:hypothetical protein